MTAPPHYKYILNLKFITDCNSNPTRDILVLSKEQRSEKDARTVEYT